MGIGVHHRLYRDNADHRLPRSRRRSLVNHCRQRASGRRIWNHVVRRTKIRQQKRLDFLGTEWRRTLANRLPYWSYLSPTGSARSCDGNDWRRLHFAGRLRALARTR